MEKIAIIGMSGSFPGAGSISELWSLIKDKGDGTSGIDKEELLRSGVSR